MSVIQPQDRYQVLPDMPEEQFRALKADIAERGVLTPIDVDEHGFILDGHHRHRACLELGVTDFPTIVRPGLTEEERRMFARKSNMLRRHLTRAQTQQLIAEQLKDTPNWANNRIAQALGVDSKTVLAVREQLESTSEIPKFDRLIGADGKERPVKQKRPAAIMASTLDELSDILRRSLAGESLGDVTGFTFAGNLQSARDDLDHGQQQDWTRFADLMMAEGMTAEGIDQHIEWLVRNGWKSPDEWLGPEGCAYRERLRWRRIPKRIEAAWLQVRQ